MRSLPIAKAFLKPFASSCRGSSTGCFVLLVTESDCRRPRKVGVRQELVRVSVRAVDIFLSFAGSPPSAASGVSGGPCLCAQVLRWAEELGAGFPAGFGWLGTHSSRVVPPPRRASVASAREGRFATETRSGLLASSIRSLRIAPPSQSPQSPPSDGCVETSKTRHP